MPSIQRILWASLAFTATTTWARRPTEGPFCFGACQYPLQLVRFNDTPAQAGKFGGPCRSELLTTSLYLCTAEHCSTQQREEALTGYNETCEERGNVTLPSFESVIAEWSEEDIAGLRRLTPEEARWDVDTVVGEVVLPDERVWTLAYRTLSAASFESEIHIIYGSAMYYFWAIVIAVGISARLIGRIVAVQRKDWQRVPEYDALLEESAPGRKTRPVAKPSTWLKRYITVPATFGGRCSQSFGSWGSLPPRIHSLTIAAFVVINVVLCSVSYRVFVGNVYWPTVKDQLLRYVSDRTGIISLANFPLVWLFGMRNDLLMWVTGWGFGTYNSFHRWVARVATVEAVVHSVGYTAMVLGGNGGWDLFKRYWRKKWWWMGELATIFMVAICVFSFYALRRSHYEIFLWLHIVFSVVVLVGMWYHVEIFHGAYNGYIYPCIIVWALDRVLRTFRILAFNWRFWSTKAVATYDASSDIVRLTVPCSANVLPPQPGTYYYLYSLSDLPRIWENHPFTLAYSTPIKAASATDLSRASTPRSSSAPSLGTITPTQLSPSRSASPGTLDQTPHALSSSEQSHLLAPEDDHDTTNATPSLTFIIRPYSSFTARLRDAARHAPTSLRVLIEGPYGSPPPLANYDRVLFIVGGTGVAVPLSHLDRLTSTTDAATAAVRSVRVVWAVRERAFLVQSLTRDFAPFLTARRLQLHAFVTRDAEAVEAEGLLGGGGAAGDPKDEDDGRGPAVPPNVLVNVGRPDVRAVLAEAVEEMEMEGVDGVGGGCCGCCRLAVVACGPGRMADEVRAAVVECLRDVGPRVKVDYFEESFGW